jgi:large conductance mechanosensitive channel
MQDIASVAFPGRIAPDAPGFISNLRSATFASGRRHLGPARKAQFSRGTKMLKEFQDFAMKGNVVDLAIGVIIGAAFGKIVESMVNDLIMPIIGAIGGADFSNYFFGLSHAVVATNLGDAKKQGPVFAYGNFLTVAVNFLIIAFVLFLVVKAINTMRKPAPVAPSAPPPPSQEVVLLTQIRDSLQK